jgi:hypothetical protein
MSFLFPHGCLVVVGMEAEAALVPPGVRVVRSGGDVARLQALLSASDGATALLSFGIAGGLVRGWRPGSLVARTPMIGRRAWPRCRLGGCLGRLQRRAPGPRRGQRSVVGQRGGEGGAASPERRAGRGHGKRRRRALRPAPGLPFAALRAMADPRGCPGAERRPSA